jgi:hypothetical protein
LIERQKQHVSAALFVPRFPLRVETVLGQPCCVPVHLKMSVTITADRSTKFWIALDTNGVLYFECRNSGFWAIKTSIRTEELATFLDAQSAFDGLWIFHAAVSGLT